jgi:hypothetical protein
VSVTAGRTLVVTSTGSTTTANITSVVWDPTGDNQAFTEIDSVQRNDIHSQWIFVLGSVTSTKSGIVKVTYDAAFAATAHVTELSGTNVGSPVGDSGAATGTSTTPRVSLNCAANSTIIALVSNNSSFGASVITQGAGYTKLTTSSTSGADEYANVNSFDAHEYLVDSGSAGTKTVDFAFAGSSPWIIRAVEIKAAGGAPTSILLQMLLNS